MRSITVKQLNRMGLMPLFGLLSISLLSSTAAEAAVRPEKTQRPKFSYDLSEFHSSLNLPLSVKDHVLKIPERQIDLRLRKSSSDSRIEPLQFTVDLQEDKLMDLASRVAKPNHKLAIANYLKNNFDQGEEIPGTKLRLVSVSKEAFDLLEPGAVDQLFSKIHHDVTVNSWTLRQNRKDRAKFLSQVSPFLSNQDLRRIEAKIDEGLALSMDKDLLPNFARKRIASHTIYRGPNCFHAALGFQSSRLASSSLVNVRREAGYHQDMLNYDELWRILNLSFYEIDPRKSELQYGDMIVFFEAKDAAKPGIDYKTLRHAATYLLGGYVFAKGSKSANSPYLVRTLGEEWKTWSKYTQKLGVKVFRRNLKSVTNPLPEDPSDWVY